jgi:hypothetical protein
MPRRKGLLPFEIISNYRNQRRNPGADDFTLIRETDLVLINTLASAHGASSHASARCESVGATMVKPFNYHNPNIMEHMIRQYAANAALHPTRT